MFNGTLTLEAPEILICCGRVVMSGDPVTIIGNPIELN
jgi:hypothetical protein